MPLELTQACVLLLLTTRPRLSKGLAAHKANRPSGTRLQATRKPEALFWSLAALHVLEKQSPSTYGANV
jgi:hypothetical protein